VTQQAEEPNGQDLASMLAAAVIANRFELRI